MDEHGSGEPLETEQPIRDVTSSVMPRERHFDLVRDANSSGGGASAAAVAETSTRRWRFPRHRRTAMLAGQETVSSVLRRSGLGISEDLFAEALERVLRVMKPPGSVNPADHFTSGEIADLETAGLDMSALTTGEIERLHASDTASRAALLASSLTVKEVAERLMTTPEAVARLLEHRALLAFEWQEDWWLPSFQFENSAPVRGLSDVLARLPNDADPFTVWRWFVEPNEALDYVHPVSPLDWLRRGGNVANVCELAETAFVV